MNLKFLGLLIILLGLLIKVVLQNLYPNGFLIDLCRLSFFVGIIVLIVGFFKGKSSRK